MHCFPLEAGVGSTQSSVSGNNEQKFLHPIKIIGSAGENQ
jgi:hypothetical protein